MSGTTGGVPARNKKSERPDIAWVGGPRETRPGQTEYSWETWITAPIGDGTWTIGYLIDAAGGVPRPAEIRIWQTNSPPWATLREPTPSGVMPSLDKAQRTLSPQQAVQAWFELSENTHAGRGALHFAPREHGYDPAAVQHSPHPEDAYYAEVAERYVAIRRVKSDYSADLARELGVSQSQARKFVRRCRERNLLAGDDLTAYALELLKNAA